MINRLVINPHMYVWLSVPFILLIGYFTKPALTVNFHDIYYVMESFPLSLGIAFCFGLIGLLYKMAVKRGYQLKTVLTIIHLAATVDVAFFIWLFFIWTNNAGLGLRTPSPWVGFVYLGLLLIFIIGQVLFLLNLIQAHLRPKLKVTIHEEEDEP